MCKFARQIQKSTVKKIRLPQPYAQMVVCGALQTIPNLFDDAKRLEKVFIFAEDFTDCMGGLNVDYKLHQRVWNEMTLGNIPDETFHYDCFIGYVIVSSEEKPCDKWYSECQEHLQVKSAKEFRSYIADYDTAFSILESAKTKGSGLKRMIRNGNKLTVPLGKRAWRDLKYKETLRNVFLFWEPYMSRITHFLFSANTNDEDIAEIVFKYHNQTKICGTYSAGSDIISIQSGINKKEKPVYKHYYAFSFSLEHIIKGGCVEEFPSMPKTAKTDEDAEEDDFSIREYRNPWPRFISTPMGGMNKRYRR